MSFDSIFQEVGENGRYQIFYVIFLAIGEMVVPLAMMSPIFTSYDRDFFCSSWGNSSTVANMCKPPQNKQNHSVLLEFDPQICSDHKWVFDTSIFSTSLQSKYLLICNRAFMAPLATTIFMIGFLIGCTFYGYLADIYGRVKMVTVTGFHGFIVGVFTPFAPNVWLYFAGRLLNGIACGGFYTVISITFSEMTTTKYRVNYVLLGQVFWVIGAFVQILISYLQRNHMYLEMISSFFYILPLSAIFVLPECPRWLACQGRFDEAFKIMQRFGKISKEKYDELIIPIMAETKSEKDICIGNKFDFLRLPNMRRTTFLLWLLFINTAFLAYAFAFSSAKFTENPHVSKLIMTLPSFLNMAVFFGFTNKIDRVTFISLGFLFGCLCCCILAPMSLDKATYGVGILIIATVANFIFNLVLSVMWLYIVEVYPTELRNTGVGSVSTWARVGSLLSPQVIELDQIYSPLPYIVYSIMAFITAIISLGLPETRGVVTLDSIVDAERLAGEPNRLTKCIGRYSRKSISENSSVNEESIPMNLDDKAF